MRINSKKDLVLFLRREESFIKENLKTIKLMEKELNIRKMEIRNTKVPSKMANLLDKDMESIIDQMEIRSMKVP